MNNVADWTIVAAALIVVASIGAAFLALAWWIF